MALLPIAFAVAFAAAIVLTPLCAKLARATGHMAAPRGDRWHRQPTAMLGGLPYTRLRDAILTHPTKAEGLNVLFTNIAGTVRGGGS